MTAMIKLDSISMILATNVFSEKGVGYQVPGAGINQLVFPGT